MERVVPKPTQQTEERKGEPLYAVRHVAGDQSQASRRLLFRSRQDSEQSGEERYEATGHDDGNSTPIVPTTKQDSENARAVLWIAHNTMPKIRH